MKNGKSTARAVLTLALIRLLAGCSDSTTSTSTQQHPPPPPPPPPPTLSIWVTPYSVNLSPGATQQFTANVTGTNNRVRWSASWGTITDTGLYTAPNGGGTFEVRASLVDDSRFASAMVWVGGPLYIGPSSAYVAIGASQQFSAIVHEQSVATTSLNWSVYEGDSGGSITSTGLYTAPLQTGTYHLIARSKANDSDFAVVAVSVYAANFVVIQPSDFTVPLGGTQQLTAIVPGASTQPSFTWSVQRITSAGQLGTINDAGLYTAPSSGESSAAIIAHSSTGYIGQTTVYVSSNPCYGRTCGASSPNGEVCCTGSGCQPADCDSDCGHRNACGACVPTGVQECGFFGSCSDGVCYEGC